MIALKYDIFNRPAQAELGWNERVFCLIRLPTTCSNELLQFCGQCLPWTFSLST